MKKAVVLFSGGLDSTTCLAYALSEGYDCYALSFDYGQKHKTELIAAQMIAKKYKVKHEIFPLSFGKFGGSALTDPAITVPEYEKTSDIPQTYVPARNTIMLSIGLGWAEILNAEAIFIGVSAIDYSNYPDCRPEFIHAFTELAKLATKKGVEGTSITIETPLIHLSKAETVQLGMKLGVDYGETISCYKATDEGLACGRCHSCVLRKKGFEESHLLDPTHYIP